MRPRDLIDLNEAAKLLQTPKGRTISTGALARWVRRKKLRGWRRDGKWHVSRADVLAMIRPYTPEPSVASRSQREREIREAERRVRG